MSFLKTCFSGKDIVLEIQYDQRTSLDVLQNAIRELKEMGLSIALDNVDNEELIHTFETEMIDIVKVYGELIRHLLLMLLLSLHVNDVAFGKSKISHVATQLNASRRRSCPET